jgi:hypothetical protein
MLNIYQLEYILHSSICIKKVLRNVIGDEIAQSLKRLPTDLTTEGSDLFSWGRGVKPPGSEADHSLESRKRGSTHPLPHTSTRRSA